jgi:DNA-binding transcriptional MerR regulator
MSRNQKDITIEEIGKLLQREQNRIESMENTSTKSREKIQKINRQLDEQEKQIIEIITNIAYAQQSIDNLEDFNENDDSNFTIQINDILANMRKIRLTLANVIKTN